MSDQNVDDLIEEVKRLRGLLGGEPQLVDASLGEFKVKHWAVRLIVSSLFDTLEGMGAKNYVTMDLAHPTKGAVSVTVQRKYGKSPADVQNELRENFDKLLGVCRTYVNIAPQLSGEAYRDLVGTVNLFDGHKDLQGWPQVYDQLKQKYDLMKECLLEWEKWENSLIMDDKCWAPDGMADTPQLTEEQFKDLTERLQPMRNRALGRTDR